MASRYGPGGGCGSGLALALPYLAYNAAYHLMPISGAIKLTFLYSISISPASAGWVGYVLWVVALIVGELLDDGIAGVYLWVSVSA